VVPERDKVFADVMIRPLAVRRLAILAVMPVALAADPFDDWPAGASQHEVGVHVTENFLARPHMMMPPDGVIHYAEVCTWIGALSFAQASGDKELTTRLVERF
jgi:hypothetical protein